MHVFILSYWDGMPHCYINKRISTEDTSEMLLLESKGIDSYNAFAMICI